MKQDHHHRRRRCRTRRRLQDQARGRRGARRRVRARREGRPPRRQARHRASTPSDGVHRRRRLGLLPDRQARRAPRRQAPRHLRRRDADRREQEDVHRQGRQARRDARRHHDVRAHQDHADGHDGCTRGRPSSAWRSTWSSRARSAGPRARRARDDETLESFVVRRMGRECLDRLAEPLVGGVNGSDPAEMSLAATYPKLLEMEQKHGSLVRGSSRSARRSRR